MSSNAPIDGSGAARWQRRSLWVGTIALSVSALGASFSPVALFRACLAAYLFYLGIALGSMVLLMVYHLTGGSWGFLVRRILEAGMRTLPLLAVLFVPIACGIGYLYPWAQPDAVAASPQLQYQQFYLAPTWFWVRAVVYFAVWLAMAFLLASWSRKEDETGQDPGTNARLVWKSRQLGAFGAVAYGISLHFAAIDWGMSLQPAFHSTIWGPLFATGQLLSALAFALVVLAWRVNQPPLSEVDSPKVRIDLASLLLTLLIVWAYMAWFQFMLIWIANLPVDVVWYLPRATSPWQWVMWAIVIFHFTVPFFLLLVRRIKRNSKAVAGIAGLVLFMHLLFMDYQVIPDFPFANLGECWMALLVPIGIGGLWLARFLWQLERYPLLPLHDHNRAAALRLRHLDAEESAREEALVLMDKEKAIADQWIEQRRGDETKEIRDREGPIEHTAARYERRDIRLRWLMVVVVGVCCYAVVHYYGVWRFLWFQEHAQAEAKKSHYPQASAPSTAFPPDHSGRAPGTPGRGRREAYTGVPPSAPLPPEPRLEQLDRMTPEESAIVNKQLAAKEKALHSYGSAAEKGFVQVPIEQAMKAVAGSLPVAMDSSRGEAAKGNGLLEAGESNSGRMFREQMP